MNQGRGLLAGRRALVTGAATGIGRAIVEAFVREGARVAVTDIDLDGARDLAESLGEGTRAYRLDVTDAAETASVFRAAAAWMGGLDLLAANAGISTMNPVVDLTEEEWDSNMAVNAKGVFLSNREAVRHFVAAGETGTIVNTASLAGKIGAPLLAHYAASKFAVVGFTQSLAREVGEHGISRQRGLPRLRPHVDAGPRGRVGGEAPRHDARGRSRAIRRGNALGPARGARGRRGDRRLPGERSLRLPDRRVHQRQRRRADGLTRNGDPMTWLKDSTGTDKPVIAMAHLLPLPGAPLYDADGGMQAIVDHVAQDIEALQAGGVDAVMFGNEGDRPYLLEASPESLAAMAAAVAATRGALRVPFGVNYLWDRDYPLDTSVGS